MKLSECNKCKLSTTRLNVCLPHGDYKKSKIMFIGEAPGRNEDEAGVPFIGKAGEILNEHYLKPLGLNRSEIYITNMVKCRPPGNRDPKPSEVDRCLFWMRKEFKLVKPNVIVLLGRIAIHRIAKRGSVENARDSVVYDPKLECYIICTYHPASIVYKKERLEKVKEDIEKIRKLSNHYE